MIRLLRRVCKPLGPFKGYTDPDLGLQAILESDCVDLVLVDLEMDGLNGLDLIRQIRSQSRFEDLPVIVLTGSRTEEHETAALATGATDFVSKPVSPSVLRLRIQTHGENRRLRQQLADLASSDTLTGLQNRRGLEERLGLELRRAMRTDLPLSLALFDVDHFKHINDTYGHPTGDEALKMVANTLRQSFQRVSDCVSRIGGEEFLVMSAGAPSEEFCQRVESCRRLLAKQRIQSTTVDVHFGLTASAGAVTFFPKLYSEHSATLENLLELVDTALYEAKVTRDRLVWIELENPQEPKYLTSFNDRSFEIRPNKRASGWWNGGRLGACRVAFDKRF